MMSQNQSPGLQGFRCTAICHVQWCVSSFYINKAGKETGNKSTFSCFSICLAFYISSLQNQALEYQPIRLRFYLLLLSENIMAVWICVGQKSLEKATKWKWGETHTHTHSTLTSWKYSRDWNCMDKINNWHVFSEARVSFWLTSTLSIMECTVSILLMILFRFWYFVNKHSHFSKICIS